MKTYKFYKLASKALKKININRTMNKMDNSSDSNSDSSIKQEIHKSKLVKKSDRNKRVVDE